MSLTQISASAGSGKTYALTRHFLELLFNASPLPRTTGCALRDQDCGYSLAEILAATFTNKAAAEMKTRVVHGLKEEALRVRATGATPHQTQGQTTAEDWVELILRHYGSLNIRTIDSLLASLVRLSALELKLPPDFTLSFTAEEYFTPLYDALMDELAQEQHVPNMRGPGPAGPGGVWGGAPTQYDAATLRARLSEACRSLLYLRDFKGFTPKGQLHNLLLELVNRLLRDEETPLMDSGAIYARLGVLHAAMRESCDSLLEIITAEGLEAAKNFLNFIRACAAAQPHQPVPDSVYSGKACLDDCLNKASKGRAPVRAERAFERAKAAIAAHGAALPSFRHALQLAPLTELAHELFARMQERRDKLLPAPRLPVLAGDLLCGQHGVSDALCRLSSRLSRLLLDEFQDTSREQWRVIQPLALESLSTGGSLTLVGDVKQAIYGWRGGDARLFGEAVADPELRDVARDAEYRELEYNWRSHPAVVAHNNAFFTLLGQEQMARSVLSAMLPPHTPESYRELAAQETIHNYTKARQNIPPQKNWERDPKSALAGVRLYQVNAPTVAGVQELVRERLHRLLLEELLPHWRYGDIAILVRSGEEANLAAEWLSAWGIPVVTENSFLLAGHPLVGRLVSFLSFLDYPLDDLAFWEFISSNWSDWNDRNDQDDWLARIVRLHGGKRIPLYQHFRRDFPAVWESFIEPFYSGAGLMSAYDTLLEAVKRFGLLERAPAHTPFVRRLLELAHLAESRGHPSLAAFLAFWRNCKDDEKLPLPEHMDAVRIMTVHKAKGLEFSVVILPFQHKGKRREPELAAVSLHGLPLLTRAGRELPDLYYPACITDELERLNLLYVAWTRPIYALHAFITRPAGTSTPLIKALEELVGAYRQKFGDTLCQWETLGEDLDSGPVCCQTRKTPFFAEGVYSYGTRPEQKISLTTYHSKPSRYLMAWLPRLKIYRSPLPDLHFTARGRSILAHLCLEHLILNEPLSTADAHIRRAVRQGMRLFPLPLDDPERIEAELITALAWFAKLPEAPLWLARGLREQGIMDEQGRMHRVDLLAPMDDGSLHAVDYKTGHIRKESGEEHLAQVRRYMRLAAQATGKPVRPERPVRGFLVYLDERQLLEVQSEGGV